MRKRIMLVHALRESVEPIRQTFAEGWPEAATHNLLDDSLSADLERAGGMTTDIIARFRTLGRYAAGTGADGILFTCSAFRPAIDAVKQDLGIPVLRPNEAAFEEALAIGNRIGLLVSFGPSLASLRQELTDMAGGRPVTIEARLVEGALEA